MVFVVDWSWVGDDGLLEVGCHIIHIILRIPTQLAINLIPFNGVFQIVIKLFTSIIRALRVIIFSQGHSGAILVTQYVWDTGFLITLV